MIRVGPALHRLANELTALLAGLIGYAAVLAALGVGVIYLLDMDTVGAAIEPKARPIQAAVERPYVVDGNQAEALARPESRQAAAR